MQTLLLLILSYRLSTAVKFVQVQQAPLLLALGRHSSHQAHPRPCLVSQLHPQVLAKQHRRAHLPQLLGLQLAQDLVLDRRSLQHLQQALDLARLSLLLQVHLALALANHKQHPQLLHPLALVSHRRPAVALDWDSRQHQPLQQVLLRLAWHSQLHPLQALDRLHPSLRPVSVHMPQNAAWPWLVPPAPAQICPCTQH